MYYTLDDDVLWLEISMDDLEEVEISDGLTNLFDCVGCTRFTQPCFFLNDFVELSWWTDLKQQVNVVFVMEEAIEFDDVGVVQEHLDLEFSRQLVQDILLFDDFFGDCFHGAYEACEFVSS